MSTLKDLTFSIVVTALAVAGVLLGVPWAANLTIFLFWFTIVVAVVYIALPLKYIPVPVRRPQVIKSVLRVFAFARVGVFAAGGWFLPATVLFIGLVIVHIKRDLIDRARQDNA